MNTVKLVVQYLNYCHKHDRVGLGKGPEPQHVPAGVKILSCSPDEQVEACLAAIELPPGWKSKTVVLKIRPGLTLALPHDWRTQELATPLTRALLQRKLPFTPSHLTRLAASLLTNRKSYGLVLRELHARAAIGTLPRSTLSRLRRVRIEAKKIERPQYRREVMKLLDDILGDRAERVFDAGDPWTDLAQRNLASMPENRRAAWMNLLRHTLTATGSKPSAKWMKFASECVSQLPQGEFSGRLIQWIEAVDHPRKKSRQPGDARLMDDVNADIMRGLLWTASTIDDAALTRTVGRLSVSAFKKLPGVGPRAVKIGNACIYALGQMPSPEALGQLAYLRVKIKFGAAQKELTKALNAAATRLGVPADEIDEMGVPSYGLTEVGASSEPIGDFTAELRVNESNRCEIAWRKPDGKLQKSVPAAIKANFADDLKDLKARAKDVEKMLPAQRDRIDSLFLARKSWPVAVWRERYLDHPLVGTIARRIIWRFTNGEQSSDGMWLGNRIVNVDAEPLEWIDDPETRVELWHPIGRPMDDVLSWRGFLERHEIRQPFKQAHREVYPLTDAERRTGTYSNRFAAHVLRQHQFHALCAVRGWKDQLRLMVDATVPPPTKRLPQWGLRAEFWVEGAGDQPGTDTTDTGTFLFLTTDQVRFYSIDAPQREVHVMGGGYFAGREQRDEPLPLDSIPPLALSEILRDVDLFVGVASVGNDPAWSDGGPEGRYREYWAQFSFGDLTAAGEVRRDVLWRLIPRLKIAPRCKLDEKYLVVRGDLRSYKIHLGSGNILMTPNDQYLCIVPKSSEWAPGQVFLPFEGDRTLSIILSKAMLLAEDTKISDPTIVSQIKR